MRRQRGELERAVLEVLWDNGGWLTPAEVGDLLDAELAYTTVVTVLKRLFDKGIVSRETAGRAHEYRPYLDREEYAAQTMLTVLAGALDPATALNHFVATIDDSHRRQLVRLLRKRR